MAVPLTVFPEGFNLVSPIRNLNLRFSERYLSDSVDVFNYNTSSGVEQEIHQTVVDKVTIPDEGTQTRSYTPGVEDVFGEAITLEADDFFKNQELTERDIVDVNWLYSQVTDTFFFKNLEVSTGGEEAVLEQDFFVAANALAEESYFTLVTPLEETGFFVAGSTLRGRDFFSNTPLTYTRWDVDALGVETTFWDDGTTYWDVD